MFKLKQILIIFCIIVVFATAILFTVSPKKEKPVVNNESDVVQAKPITILRHKMERFTINPGLSLI